MVTLIITSILSIIRRTRFLLYGLLAGFFCLASCSDKVDKRDRYTFLGMTVTDYIRNQKNLSLFSKALEKSHNSSNSRNTVSTLLGTRGHYAVFAPDNDAIKMYLDSVYSTKEYNTDTMSEETANRIVLNCVMDFGNSEAFRLTDLYEGALTENTLNDRHIVIRFGDWGDGIFVKINNTSRVLRGDLECTNGYVHIVDRVITPAPNTLPGLLETVGNLRIFTRLLEITGWEDSLVLFRDRSYVQPNEEYPQYRIHSYMAFVETDEVFHKDWNIPLPVVNKETGGVENWNEIERAIATKCREAYPSAQDDNPKSTQNALNQFVSYHLIPFKQPFDKLVSHNHIRGYADGCQKLGIEPINVWNYFQTMGKPNRLLKITETATDGVKHLNRHCLYDNSFFGTYKETSCDMEGITVHGDNGAWENYCTNGYYYPIDNVLLYDDRVKYTVLNERIRYNFTQNLPEIITNGLQYSTKSLTADYCDNLILRNGCSMETSGTTGGVVYGNGKVSFYNTDVTFKLMSVPFPGRWEIRITYPYHIFIGDKYRVVFRKFFGTNPHSATGMAYKGELQLVARDILNIETDEDLGFDSTLCMENDRMMQAYCLKKGPKLCGEVRSRSLNSQAGSGAVVYRWLDNRNYLSLFRYTFSREYLEPDKDYYIRLQGVVHPQSEDFYYTPFMIELVPENIYDYPDKAEDPW